MTTRFGAICAAGAGAIVALGLFAVPVRAEGDAQKAYVDCLGEHAIELCTGTKPAPGAAPKPPAFEDAVAACAAERVAFVDLVTARNLAGGRTAEYAARRVDRHTRRLERLVHGLYDKCMDTTP